MRAEVWHPRQRARDLPDGGLELRVPYGASQELEMDILRHGEQVQVLRPASLREQVAARLRQAVALYSRPDGQVAQLVEQRTENPRVGGSIPPQATSSTS